MILPNKIKKFLKEKQLQNNSPCDACNSSCCHGPGFALFENLKLIYEKYKKDNLEEAEFKFENNLNLKEFTYRYFDKVVLNGKLTVFFPKILSKENSILSIPPWNYYESRKYITERHGSTRCIFLRKRYSHEDLTPNSCILHNKDIENEITTKPIDCMFLNCNGIRKIINPTPTQTGFWFELLNYKFPKSEIRFNEAISNI